MQLACEKLAPSTMHGPAHLRYINATTFEICRILNLFVIILHLFVGFLEQVGQSAAEWSLFWIVGNHHRASKNTLSDKICNMSTSLEQPTGEIGNEGMEREGDRAREEIEAKVRELEREKEMEANLIDLERQLDRTIEEWEEIKRYMRKQEQKISLLEEDAKDRVKVLKKELDKKTRDLEKYMKEAEMKSIEAEEQKQGRMEAETKVQMLSRKCTQMEGEIETLKAKIRFEQAKHTKALEEQRKAEAERDKAGIEMVKPLHSQCVIVDSAQHSEMKTVRAFKEHDEAERPKKPFFNTLDVEVKQMMQHMKEQAIKAIHEREIEKIKIENWQLKKRAKAAEKKVTLLEEGGKKFIKQAIAAEVLELKNTKVIQQSLKLESTIDSIAEKMVQVTNEEQHIDLEGCGLSLHIPPDSLPGDCSQFTLNMAVSRVQDYKLPAEDGILVSPVYSFCHNLGDRKLLKPATLKMQHCVARCNQLCIVQSNDISSPYQFHIIQDGKFNDGDSYGSIELDHFCSFGVYLQWYCASLIWTIKFCAVLYYTNIKNHSFQFNLYIIPQLDAIVKVCTTIIFV